jgi:phosphoribosyl 1,2-cyclic phosphodiesterase
MQGKNCSIIQEAQFCAYHQNNTSNERSTKIDGVSKNKLDDSYAEFIKALNTTNITKTPDLIFFRTRSNMNIKFYGVRGSYSVPGKDTVKYGGNTTCVSFSTINSRGLISRIIIDSGTGIVPLGRDIISNFFAKKESLNINLFFTHLHPDHTQGFPFFGPNYFKDSQINLYGMVTLGNDIEQVLSAQMTPPTFPIEYRNMKSNRKHITIEDGSILTIPEIGAPDFVVSVMQAYAPSHPQQGALYFKIKENTPTGKSVACIWDNESKIGGDQAVINFIKSCDVVIHDTQYTQEEYKSNKMIVQGFGHSTYEMAIDTATQAGVSKLICIHYNPTHTDDKLDQIQAMYKNFDVHGLEDNFILAKEGMEIKI